MRKLGMFSLEKAPGRPFCGQCLKELIRKVGTDFLVGPFAITPLWTRGNGFKLKESRFRLHLRRISFTMRVVEHWHKLPREVDTPSLEAFKARLD